MLFRGIVYVVCLMFIAGIWISDESEAKKRRRYIPALKILDISTDPMPFAPGNGPLAITVEVELPKDLHGVDILEVSSLISLPTRRSIRFLSNRHPIEDIQTGRGKPRLKTTLLWDGKDQTKEFVGKGDYKYEIRAQLMTNKDGNPRTKLVSLRARGTFQVSAPEELTKSEAHLEHTPFVSDEASAEEVEDAITNPGANQEPELETESVPDEMVEQLPMELETIRNP